MQYTEQKRSRLVIVHFHDATDTGALGTPASTSGTAKARVSYVGHYYDAGDRVTATVDVGTNGGSAWSRPGSVPSRSDTVLVSSVTYDTAGLTYETTDPKAIVARTLSDDLGRTTKTIEHYVDGTVGDDNDKTTEYTYGPAGMTSLTAKLTGGGGQTTEWVYGVGSGSGITSNDIVGETRWPDASTGSASSSEDDHVTVNALGQPLTMTDRNGNVHTLAYDILGRVTVDTVTTLGSGVDGSVRRVETAFDSQGNAYLLTTYDATTGGNIVTQVQRAFNGLGQLTREWQSHGGAVNTGSTPSVQYAFSEMSSGANHSRLTSITYPDGYVLTYNYASGLNGDISRLSSLSDASGTLESYDYLGLSTVVKRSHPTPAIDLTFLGTGPGSGGDQYVGLDSFGRIIDHNWKPSGSSTDRFTYTYDRNGNRATRGNSVNSAFNETYTYDGLNQLTGFDRNSGAHTLAWDFDALGNFDSVTTDGGSPVTRTNNKQNEVTAVSGATSPTFDANGNMTTDETGKQYVYDAWNRLKIVKSSGGSTLKTYVYDALGRRVAETAGGATTDFYYSSDWQVLEERDTARTNDTKVRYVWSPVYVDAMILRDRDTADDGTLGERLWVQQDANWNVTALTNSSGTVVERYAYDPFGVVTVLNAGWTGIGSSAYGWQHFQQGGRLDGISGLYNYRERDVSPTLGRAAQVDPLLFSAGDVNFYRWEGNGPVNRLDPYGLSWLSRQWDDVGMIANWVGRGFNPWAQDYSQPIPKKESDGDNLAPGLTAGSTIRRENKLWAQDAQANFVPAAARGTSRILLAMAPVPLVNPVEALIAAAAAKGVQVIFRNGKAIFTKAGKEIGKKEADEIVKAAKDAQNGFKNGTFSITNWKNYPAGVTKPNGPFRLLSGAEYDTARKAANEANTALHRADPAKYAGKQIHEIHPVKFGGSPTDPANKIALTPTEHAAFTTWWNHFMRSIQ